MASMASIITRRGEALRRITAALGIDAPTVANATPHRAEFREAVTLERIANALEGAAPDAPPPPLGGTYAVRHEPAAQQDTTTTTNTGGDDAQQPAGESEQQQ